MNVALFCLLVLLQSNWINWLRRYHSAFSVLRKKIKVNEHPKWLQGHFKCLQVIQFNRCDCNYTINVNWKVELKTLPFHLYNLRMINSTNLNIASARRNSRSFAITAAFIQIFFSNLREKSMQVLTDQKVVTSFNPSKMLTLTINKLNIYRDFQRKCSQTGNYSSRFLVSALFSTRTTRCEEAAPCIYWMYWMFWSFFVIIHLICISFNILNFWHWTFFYNWLNWDAVKWEESGERKRANKPNKPNLQIRVNYNW